MALSICVEHFVHQSSSWEQLWLDALDFDYDPTVGDLRTKLSKVLKLPRTRFLVSCQHKQFLEDGERLQALDLPNLGAVLHTTDYGSLLPVFGSTSQILGTEDRGISLAQLEALRFFVQDRLTPRSEDDRLVINGWYDTYDEDHAPLYYEEINLYQISDWIIKPVTRGGQGTGERPLLPHEVGVSRRPLIRPRGCSYVETIATRPEDQLPSWFVSHAWIEPMVLFVKCLQEHCRVRHMAESTAFWICAYANNQWMLDEELPSDPRDTSFFHAMESCKRVLLVLDKDLTPFHRIWCCFEASVVVLAEETVGKPVLWDIAIVDGQGAPQILSDGVTEVDLDNRSGVVGKEWSMKSQREESFPVEKVLERALSIDIEDATASVDVDRHRILNCVCKRDPSQFDDEPVAGHAEYARVNAKLHGLFAISAWRQALAASRGQLLERLVDALNKDTERKELRLNFQYSKDLNNRKMERLGCALPAGLLRLTLNFDECHSIGNAGLVALSRGFGQHLLNLTLSFVNCCALGDGGLAGLAKFLPNKLQSLCFDFTECDGIGNGGLVALGNAFFQLHYLRNLVLNCSGCNRIGNDAVAFLAPKLGTYLEHIDLNFMHCARIHNSGVASLAASVSGMQNLRSLKLDFTFCVSISDAAAATLVSGLPSSLEVATFRVHHTGVSKDISRSCESLADMQFWLEQMQQGNQGILDVMILEPPQLDHKSCIAAARPAKAQRHVTARRAGSGNPEHYQPSMTDDDDDAENSESEEDEEDEVLVLLLDEKKAEVSMNEDENEEALAVSHAATEPLPGQSSDAQHQGRATEIERYRRSASAKSKARADSGPRRAAGLMAEVSGALARHAEASEALAQRAKSKARSSSGPRRAAGSMAEVSGGGMDGVAPGALAQHAKGKARPASGPRRAAGSMAEASGGMDAVVSGTLAQQAKSVSRRASDTARRGLPQIPSSKEQQHFGGSPVASEGSNSPSKLSPLASSVEGSRSPSKRSSQHTGFEQKQSGSLVPNEDSRSFSKEIGTDIGVKLPASSWRSMPARPQDTSHGSSARSPSIRRSRTTTM